MDKTGEVWLGFFVSIEARINPTGDKEEHFKKCGILADKMLDEYLERHSIFRAQTVAEIRKVQEQASIQAQVDAGATFFERKPSEEAPAYKRPLKPVDFHEPKIEGYNPENYIKEDRLAVKNYFASKQRQSTSPFKAVE
jgi:hypothetical protein